MKDQIKLIKQLNLMVFITILTQVIILIKNSLIALHFGISVELDAFNLANNISNFIYSFIGAGISTVIIPYLKVKGNKKGIEVFISVMYTVCIIVLAFVIIFRKEIIIIFSGISNFAFIEIASNIIIFTIISGFLNSITQVIKSFLEFQGQFNRQKLVLLFTTILLVISFAMYSNVNIYYYTTMLLITTLMNFVIHLFLLKNIELKINVRYDLKDNSFREMLKLFLPIVMSTGIYQLSLLIDTSIAAKLDVGSISVLSYSNSIISMINLVLLGNLTSFVYPKLVRKSNDKDRQNSFVSYVLFINAVMCVVIVLFMVVGKDGISFLFERGKFTSENTDIVFLCVLIYSLSLPTNGVRDLIYRYFYIKKDTYTPFINGIIISTSNILVSILLSKYIGIVGVVIGTVIASYFSLIFISMKFRNKFQIYFNIKEVFVENFKVVCVCLLTIIISMSITEVILIESVIISIIVLSVITLLIYVILLVLFKSKVFNIKF